MTRDIAVWLVELLKTRWDLAVESLRAQGETFPKSNIPTIAKESDRGVAAFRLNNGALVKVYETSPESTSFPSWGMVDKDKRAYWSIDVQVDHPSSAREIRHAIGLVIDRILELSRLEPDPDAEWDLIERWDESQQEDYADYQHAVFNITMARHGRIASTPIKEQA